eukprot:scaffold123312_cov51-Phaeocystis_antarctica.AAC.2
MIALVRINQGPHDTTTRLGGDVSVVSNSIFLSWRICRPRRRLGGGIIAQRVEVLPAPCGSYGAGVGRGIDRLVLILVVRVVLRRRRNDLLAARIAAQGEAACARHEDEARRDADGQADDSGEAQAERILRVVAVTRLDHESGAHGCGQLLVAQGRELRLNCRRHRRVIVAVDLDLDLDRGQAVGFVKLRHDHIARRAFDNILTTTHAAARGGVEQRRDPAPNRELGALCPNGRSTAVPIHIEDPHKAVRHSEHRVGGGTVALLRRGRRGGKDGRGEGRRRGRGRRRRGRGRRRRGRGRLEDARRSGGRGGDDPVAVVPVVRVGMETG